MGSATEGRAGSEGLADPLGVADPLEDPLGELCVPDGDEVAPGSAGSDEAELDAEDEAAAAAEDAAALERSRCAWLGGSLP